MKRVYNFSAGPSAMPESVLKKAADEMLCYGNSGMSVMEMSHRSKEYQAIINSAFSYQNPGKLPSVSVLPGTLEVSFGITLMILKPKKGGAYVRFQQTKN